MNNDGDDVDEEASLSLKSVDFFFYGSLECWRWWCSVVVLMMMKKIKINLFLIFVYLNKINNMINSNNNDMEILFFPNY
jgi:hypothetical protein